MDRIVVIGGGIAGLSVTWALAKQGRRVLLLEKESRLAQHSSAVNAGILRLSVAERINVRLALRSLVLGRELMGDGYVDLIGGLFPCDDETKRRAILDAASDAGLVQAPKSMLPDWMAFRDRPALWSPQDGIINVPGLLAALEFESRRLGAEIRTGALVSTLETANGRVTGVVLNDERVDATTVIDATGAWSPTLPGAPALPAIRPHRRHIFVLERVANVEAKHVVWDLTENIYARPARDGIMTCPCDETPHAADAAHETNPEVLSMLRSKLSRWAPALVDAPVVRWWAGLRPLTADHRFVIGEDPSLHGLVRLGGFGGHGITAGLAAGELAARVVSGEDVPEANELSPRRFAHPSVN